MPDNANDMQPKLLSTAFKGFAEFAAMKRLDVGDVLARAGFDPTILEDNDSTISLNAFSELLELCAKETGNQYFGMHYGEYYALGSSGAFGYLILNSATV